MDNCNVLFKPGYLTIIQDGGAGSSGKGKLGSYITENSDNFTFACNAFAPQAGHWVRLDDGRTYFYQQLNSCAYNVNKYEKLYIGAGSIIELPALFKEISDNKIPYRKLGISPMAMILEDFDAGYERGQLEFNSHNKKLHDGTMKTGSTSHGCGSAAARRLLRTNSVRLARDVPELSHYLCNVQDEICDRLNKGESGLLELAQGFQLSLLYDRFYPNVTSRNVTVAQGMSDMFLPIKYAGPLVLNFRTFPIRISNNKYIAKDDGRHLTWAEIEAGVPHDVYRGNSGDWYEDQHEISWDELTKLSGSPSDIIELTSVTKLPRRVATFSKLNVQDAIKYNDTGHEIFISVNFANYVDYKMSGVSDNAKITQKFYDWKEQNFGGMGINIVGTGMKTSETIWLG